MSDPNDSYLSRSASVDAVNSANSSMPDFVNSSEIGRRFMEPEENVTEKPFNRNLQMGNIERNDLLVMESQWNSADLIYSIPEDNGKFLFSWVGDHIVKNIHFKLATSNSVDGRGRQSVISRIVRSFSKDETQQGGFSSLLNRKKE
jgi:hypothetical protein